MSDMEKIESDEMENWRIREERREIYQMVAVEHIGCILDPDDLGVSVNLVTMKEIEIQAEAIYQGMLKFCGDKA